MTGSARTGDGRCLSIHEGVNRVGGRGEGMVKGPLPERRLADDGKRLHRRWTLYPDRLFLFKNRVGGLGEGGRPVAPDTRLADL